MKIEIDPMANAAYIRRFTGKVVDSEEVEPGIIYDYDANDTVIGIEILGIKQRAELYALERYDEVFRELAKL